MQKDDISFRPASKNEYEQGARLLMETLHQFGVYLFGFGDEKRAVRAVQSFFQLPSNRFSHQFAEYAWVGDEIAGLLMTFDQRQIRRSEIATAFQMFKVYGLGEVAQFIKRILPYRNEENISEDELYIAHLAVEQKFRRQGIGWRMLERAEKKAHDRKLPKLSLLTEIENTAAQNLYEKFGFVVTDTLLFPEQMPDVGSRGDVRMVKILK